MKRPFLIAEIGINHNGSLEVAKKLITLAKKYNFELIVLDLVMPVMDGFEFLEAYMKKVKEDKRAPILVYSGKDLSEVQESLLKDNVAGMVRKDEVSMEDLSTIVKNIYSESLEA